MLGIGWRLAHRRLWEQPLRLRRNNKFIEGRRDGLQTAHAEGLAATQCHPSEEERGVPETVALVEDDQKKGASGETQWKPSMRISKLSCEKPCSCTTRRAQGKRADTPKQYRRGMCPRWVGNLDLGTGNLELETGNREALLPATGAPQSLQPQSGRGVRAWDVNVFPPQIAARVGNEKRVKSVSAQFCLTIKHIQ